MADELFADVKSEGATLDIDKSLERVDTKGEQSSESQSETNTASASRKADESTSSEEKTPFHKHPRWIKTQQELKEMREKVAQFESSKPSTPELPAWWKNQYGDTKESLERYQAVTQKDGELDWIKQSVLSEIDNRTKTDTTQMSEANEYVDTQISEMTDEGLKFDRNSLLKFMVDFQKEFGAGSLLDQEGNYDFRKALSMKNRMQPEEVEDASTKKQLASQASKSKASSGTSSQIPVVSAKALRKGGWRDAVTGQFT